MKFETPMKRTDVTDLIVFRRVKKGIKWTEVAKKVGASKEWQVSAVQVVLSAPRQLSRYSLRRRPAGWTCHFSREGCRTYTTPSAPMETVCSPTVVYEATPSE